MRNGSHRPQPSPSEEERQRAAGLLLHLVREAAGRTQKEVARQLHVSEDRIGDFERGLLPRQDARRRCLEIAAAYGLWPSVANRFLSLLDEEPLTPQERLPLAGRESEGANPVRLLFSTWPDRLSDGEIEELALVLAALGDVANRQGILRRPMSILAEEVGAQVAQALIDRGAVASSARSAVPEVTEPVESLLAEIADDRVKELERRVKDYVGRGVHSPEGEELAITLRDLIRIAPRRWRPHLRYLRGWLHAYSQSYVESVEELDRALHEFSVSDDDLTSLRTLADATYAAALAYMNVGNREAFEKAQVYLRRAEGLYQDLEQVIPNYSKQTALNRLNTALQRARVLTWGYRRGMGARFEEAENIYRMILEGDDNREILESDPFFHASVLKERADNLRVGTELSGHPHVPERARRYFQEAVSYYDVAQVEAGPWARERHVECCLNRGYIHRLLGNQEASRREMGRAHRMALSARLVRQIGHTLLHMAESEWRSPRSRVFAAYVGAALSGKIGARRNEDVCKEIVKRLSPALGDEVATLMDRATKSRYAEFF